MERAPIYALYGESISAIDSNFLHFERIYERSQHHDWTIRAHRHDKLAQIFLFHTAGVHVEIANRRVTTDSMAGLFIPPMISHGFHFPKNIKGGVVSVEMSRLFPLIEANNLTRTAFDAVGWIGDESPHFRRFKEKFAAISLDYRSMETHRNEAMANETAGLLLCFARSLEAQRHQKSSELLTRQEQHVRRFCLLVEDNFRTDYGLDFYAREVGISKVQLTRLCREILKRTPLETLAARKLLEAKRQLEFTQYPVSYISEELGFNDVAYFSRFFKHRTGLSPMAFRRKAGL